MASKYKRGSRISCMEELLSQETVFFRGKVLHKSFFKSWQIRYTEEQIRLGTLCRAEKMGDGSDYEKQFLGTEVGQ